MTGKFRGVVAILALAIPAVPLAATAQPRGRPPRIGFLGTFPPSAAYAYLLDAFRGGLRDLGYVEGQTIVIEVRSTEGDLARLPTLAADLVGRKVVWNAANPYPALVLRETETAARALGVQVQSLEVRGPGDLASALEAGLRGRAGALLVAEDPLTLGLRTRIADFAAKNRLPAMYAFREFVDDARG